MRRKALRICHINGMEVRKKTQLGVQEEAQGVQVSPLNPLSVSPCASPAVFTEAHLSTGCQRPAVCRKSRVQPATAGAAHEIAASSASQHEQTRGGGPWRVALHDHRRRELQAARLTEARDELEQRERV